MAYIRKLEEQNQIEREEKEMPDPIDNFKMKRFSNVKSKLSQMWNKENSYLEKRGYVSPSRHYNGGEQELMDLRGEVVDALSSLKAQREIRKARAISIHANTTDDASV